VINLSLGISTFPPFDDAVAAAIRNCSIAVVAAAGNSDKSASDYSPARVAEAIAVGSIGPDDTRSSFSNWGPRVDVFAPGRGYLLVILEGTGTRRRR
jgi:subtilisin family serine protease